MSRLRQSRREKMRDEVQQEAEMDMTPMIDVVFLLIIFFLCIDFKVLEAKLPAYLPKDKGSQTFDTEPIEQLSLKIVCTEWGTEITRRKDRPKIDPETGRKNAYKLEGHRVRYELGPKKFTVLDDLIKELRDIALDPSKRVPDKNNPGQTKLMTVVIEPGSQAVYSDVANAVDAVAEAGFSEINFGGGLGAKK